VNQTRPGRHGPGFELRVFQVSQQILDREIDHFIDGQVHCRQAVGTP
jgi:hypothetical protein